MEELGAGFYLAMHDLEIRGAGEVLGESQSGGIHDVGFALYTEMLEHAVKSLKAGKEPDLARPVAVATEVNLHAPALLPETYCGDVHERLVIYKRLANCAAEDDLQRLTEELVDRFGELPEPARVLLECHRLRIQGAPLGVARIDASPSAIVVQFVPDPPIDGRRIIALVQSGPRYRMPGPDRVRIDAAIADLKRARRGSAAVHEGAGPAMTAFHLVVQGADIATPDLKALCALARGAAIERDHGRGLPHPRRRPRDPRGGRRALRRGVARLGLRRRTAAGSRTSACWRSTWTPRSSPWSASTRSPTSRAASRRWPR